MEVSHRIIRIMLACAVVSVAFASTATLADLTGAQADALQVKIAAGNKVALETLKAEAGKGGKKAQFTLGVCYEDGKGVPQDYAQAAQWYRKAAEQGEAFAQYNLGVLYNNGRGVPQDYVQAVQWYRKAAEQGIRKVAFNLGLCYENGQGVPQDYRQAAQWYRKAAEQGDTEAQVNLGALYVRGQGVPQDKVVAYSLFNLAAAQASVRDRIASDNRSIISADMTSREIEDGQALTRQMNRPGNLLNALDAYLAGSAGR